MYNSVVSGVGHFCPSSAKSKGIRTLAKIGLNANTSDYSINLREIHVEDILNSHDCLLKRNIRLRTSSWWDNVSSCVNINATSGAVMYTELSKSFLAFSEKMKMSRPPDLVGKK